MKCYVALKSNQLLCIKGKKKKNNKKKWEDGENIQICCCCFIYQAVKRYYIFI